MSRSSLNGSRRGAIGLITVRSPLTKEQETPLHAEIAAGRRAAVALVDQPFLASEERDALRRVVRKGRKAEEDLLAGTCALVKKRVNDLGFSFDHDELEAAGLEGLMKALREFDPEQGVRFATYANYWISKMVFSSISHRVAYPESDLRQVIKFRRLQRNHDGQPLTVADVMRQMDLSRVEAGRVMKLSADIAAGTEDIGHDNHAAALQDAEPWPEAEWVIDQLKEILGNDFADFWMWTGRVMSLEELGRRNGVSKQAMAKRVRRWKSLVESSDHAKEMVAWLRAQ